MTVDPAVTPPPPTPTKPYKAIVAGVLGFLFMLWVNLNGRPDLGHMGWQDWLIVILGTLATGGGTYAIPNPAKTRRPRGLTGGHGLRT